MKRFKIRAFLLRAWAFFWVVWIFSLSQGCTSQSDRFYNEGLEKFNRGEVREAVREYEKGLKIDPKNRKLLYVTGWAHLVLGNSDRALVYFGKCIKFNPKYFGGYKGMGNVFLSIGQFEKAEENLKKALSLDPKNPSIYSNLGDMYRLQGNLEEAKKNYQMGVMNSGKYVDVQNGLIALEIDKKNYDQAIKMGQNSLKGIYKQTLLKAQGHFLLATAYLNRGKGFLEKGDKTACLNDLNEGLKILEETPQLNRNDVNISQLKSEIETLLKSEKALP